MKTLPSILGLLVLGTATTATATPGDLLVAEPTSGSVLEFSAGGDLSGAERFATGLSDPLGLCVGPGGEIYVAESSTGEITIITEGGDFSGAAPFAWGPFTPLGLWCTETAIFVSVPPPVTLIADITDGGELAMTAEIHATGLPTPVGFARDDTGALFSASFDVFDVSMPGDYSGALPFATGRPITTLAWTGSALWGGDVTSPAIYDLSEGGDLSSAAAVVTLPTVGMGHVDGLLATSDGRIFATTGDQIYEVASGGDHSGDAPFASGLSTGERGYTGMVEHVCSADADCADADACNGAELCVDNECVAPQGPLSCDDEDACTADGCSAATGCSHAPIPECCDEDLDCAVDELCDLEQLRCVPFGAITTGADESGGAPTSGEGTGTGGDGSETGSAEAGAQEPGEGDGCGCRSHRGPSGLGGAPLLLLALLRRRPR